MAKKREGKRVTTRVKHTFSAAEFKDRVLEKNKLEREAELREEQRASANATAKATIKELATRIVDLRSQLDDGGEMREVDAVVVMDRKKGVKTYYRFCPGQEGHDEKLKVENMTEEDFQSLPLEEAEAGEQEKQSSALAE